MSAINTLVGSERGALELHVHLREPGENPTKEAERREKVEQALKTLHGLLKGCTARVVFGGVEGFGRPGRLLVEWREPGR